MGFLAPPGVDPQADVAHWVTRTDQGEPYDDAATQEIVDLLTRYHSAYYVPTGAKGPAPLLLSAGFTDDLFPVDESLRFANRTRKRFPDTPVSLLFGDFGHQRASNKPNERARLIRAIHGWMDRFLRDSGHRPGDGVTAFVQSCPRDKATRRPLHAPTFAALSHGAIALRAHGPGTIDSGGGDPATGTMIDPAAGGGNACVEVGSAPAAGTMTLTKTVRPGRAVTLIGAVKIHADLQVDGTDPAGSQIAARLWDVAPGGTSQLLVARGLFRPDHQGAASWQLHPAAWRYRPGHTIKLELLGNDIPYARASNSSFTTQLDRLRARLPVRRTPR
jgi:predicted acyl esterase